MNGRLSNQCVPAAPICHWTRPLERMELASIPPRSNGINLFANASDILPPAQRPHSHISRPSAVGDYLSGCSEQRIQRVEHGNVNVDQEVNGVLGSYFRLPLYVRSPALLNIIAARIITHPVY